MLDMNGFYDAKGYFWLALEKFHHYAGLTNLGITVTSDRGKGRTRNYAM